MLLGVHPLLTPDLLHALASMGHGDILAIVDRNYPAASAAQSLVLKAPIQSPTDLLATLEAVLTVYPIDTFDPETPVVLGMQVVGQPDEIPPVVRAAEPIFAKHDVKVKLIERFAFYEATKKSFAIIRTLEDRPYGNFLIRKGVV